VTRVFALRREYIINKLGWSGPGSLFRRKGKGGLEEVEEGGLASGTGSNDEDTAGRRLAGA